MPALNKLVKATGESAAYHIMQGKARLCLYRVDSPHPVRDHIRAGDLLPADRGSGARVLRAFDPKVQPSTPHERKLLAEIREKGYFAGAGDRLAEVAGISAPVFRQNGELAAALTLTMPSQRFDDRHIQAVLETARELSGRV